MAQTWVAANSPLLPPGFNSQVSEGSVAYRLTRKGGAITYRVDLPGHPPLQMPIEKLVGGKRHGVSFLARVTEIGGAPLERPALIETRYLYGTPHGALERSPGFPSAVPLSYSSALGRVITPEFEEKCLSCHGQPRTAAATASSGIGCESCHGPGKPHLEAVAGGHPRSGIVNPGRLSKEASMESCSQCHSGFSPLSDPLPEDLLISSQVTALKNSECYIQSAKGLSCLQCHDPHRDSLADTAARSRATCESCHAVEAATKGRCLDCHMTVQTRGPFEMVDHWIRVHPDGSRSPHTISPRSKFPPQREFLRLIVTADRAKAKTVNQAARKGAPFFELAASNSIDDTAPGGGYLGEAYLDKMAAPLASAAAALRPGDISEVIDNGGKFVTLQRMPRDFRWQASEIEQAGSKLRDQGHLAEASAKYLEALRIYPHFLRALIFLGTTLGQQGNPQRAAGVLEFAARLYPEDAAAQYNLGLAYEALGRPADAISAYQKALAIEPSLLSAYQNLGAVYFGAGKLELAAEMFHRGLLQDPLSATLYYNLAQVKEQQGDTGAARAALDLAGKIDPSVVKKPRQ